MGASVRYRLESEKSDVFTEAQRESRQCARTGTNLRRLPRLATPLALPSTLARPAPPLSPMVPAHIHSGWFDFCALLLKRRRRLGSRALIVARRRL